jgi:hypothetical protein
MDVDVINQDNPHNTVGTRIDRETLPIVYGGSQSSTSDKLLISLSGPLLPGAISYAWTVTGPASTHYAPPPQSATPIGWNVGSIYPQAGLLNFSLTITFGGGRYLRFTRLVEVGIRTDDVIAVGWIDPEGVPDTHLLNVRDSILSTLPVDDNVTDTIGCAAFIEDTAAGQTALDDEFGPFTADERAYILYWMIYWAANQPAHVSYPRTVVPGGDFLDGLGFAADETKVANFIASGTSYKLFHRFQVKMRYVLDANTGAPTINPATGQPTFNGAPIRLHGPGETYAGATIDPCHTGLPLPTQIGPLNGTGVAVSSDRTSSINDGSPDNVAVAAFNTLMGKDVAPQSPVFWEDIGSRITFSTQFGPSAIEVMQPYPTYDIFVNGRYAGTRGQAPDPRDVFVSNPYPFGTVACSSAFGITPGGRCGNAQAAPDPTARTPDFVRW